MRERKRLFFLIVDDGSPPGNEAASAVSADMRTWLQFAIVRIEQDLAWNIGGARNLLVAMAPTEHVLLMDMDTGVPEALAAQLHTLVPKMTVLEHASEPPSVDRAQERHAILVGLKHGAVQSTIGHRLQAHERTDFSLIAGLVQNVSCNLIGLVSLSNYNDVLSDACAASKQLTSELKSVSKVS